MAEDSQFIIPPDLIRQLSEGVSSEVLKDANLKKAENSGTNLLVEAQKQIFATITILLTALVGPVIEGILDGEKLSEGAYQRLAAKALNSMLGANINPSDIQLFGESHGAAEKIGAAIFAGMGTAPSPIEPSDENAHKYVAMMANLAVEGWLNGIIFEISGEAEFMGYVKLEKVAELKDALISAFGLSRISRRVFGPYVNAVVVQPFQWKVNKTYRPTLLPLSQAAKQFLRGRKTQERFLEEGARAGLSDEDIEATLNAQRQKLSIDDWLWLERWAGIDASVVDGALADLSCDDDTRAWLRRRDFEKRKSKYLVDIATETENAYLDGLVSESSWRFALLQAYPDPDERDLRSKLVDAKRAARVKQLSHAEIKDAVQRGILSPFDYRDWLTRNNYEDDAATTLELLLQNTINAADQAKAARAKVDQQKADAAAKKAADDAARRAALEARQAAQVPSLADIKAAVLRQLVPIDRYQLALIARAYKPEDVAFLVTMLQQDVDARAQQEAARLHATPAADGAHVNIGDVERAVLEGILSIDEYARRLVDAGYNDADRALLVALMTSKIAEQKSADAVKSAAADALTKKGLSLAQAERAVKLGVWTAAQFRAWLTTAGLDDVAVATIAASLDAELAQDATAKATRDSVATELAARGISLAELERAVLAGVATLEDYRQKLLAQHYDADSVDTLVSLLASRLEAQQAAAKLRTDAATKTSADRVTLPQLERAVLLGHSTLDAYTQFLTSLGFNDNDRAALYADLVGRIQQARVVDAARQQLDVADPEDAAALASLEADVVAGARTMTDYRDALAVRGVAPSDVDALVGRLQLEVDDARDAEKLAAAVDADLVARKSLTLSQWGGAVKAGLRTEADYRAFLATQYTPADVDVLVALLEQQLEREASKGK